MQVEADLSVTVHAPVRMIKSEIDRFVGRHESWLRIHRARLRAFQKCIPL